MTLGERCDEIVRLIEETLADLASVVEPAGSPVDPARARVAVGSDEPWLPTTVASGSAS